ncbi:hypothetical protein LARV_02934 [Longilinea arvoryzae]|uniref:Uncharacterized protein n=1 Tax=Longilinea arvoryzae TaxID=360412 RepID=A0A0S7BJ22_9CHLR|nr:hypothetical protein [Longilinea arvoryzae]GAP15152.1 hypothetical protein LARV_02934 [Longilinea arvoryzae]
MDLNKPSTSKKSKVLSCVIFLFLVLTLLCGCSSNQAPVTTAAPGERIQDVITHGSFSDQVETIEWSIDEGGVRIYDSSQAGIGFVRPEDRHTQPSRLSQNDELRLDSGEPLKVDLVINAAQESTFLITAIVDYKQVPFMLDEKFGLLHEVSIKNEGALYVPLQIDISGSGAHDFIIMAFRDPYNRDRWDENERDLGQGCIVTGKRAVIIIDDNDLPFKDVTPDVQGVSQPAEVDFGLRVMFANSPASILDKSHPSKRQMSFIQTGKASRTFPYQLWLSNYELPDAVVDYGLMRFFDFHQVDFVGRDLFIAHFDGQQEVIVDDDITLPDQAGLHELQIVYVFDPYKSVLNQEVLARYVFSSSCVGIDVD